MVVAVVTVKGRPLLGKPPTVTTTVPLVALAGTGTLRLVADQVVGAAATPLKVTVLVPCVAPKFVPAIVTMVPTGPLAGARLVRVGALRVVTVKGRPLLGKPPTVRTTLPVVAPAGTGATTLVSVQLVGVAVTTPPLVVAG